jgi:hypothetical protein
MPSILWSAPVPPAATHHHNIMLRLTSLPLFPPFFLHSSNDGHYGQTVVFVFHQTREHFSKKYNLCPHVQLQTVVWLFYGSFGAVASFLLSGLSGYVDIGLILLWIWILLYLFPPASSHCCCSWIDLHFSHQSTFLSRRQNASPSW